MSRCYTFPPPGYVVKETGDESLIESIKVKKDEIKREKKDRSHKKDKKRKERENESDRSKKHRHKRRHKDVGANASSKTANNHRELLKAEADPLEKSSLTVELEVGTSSQNSCDSTFQSNEMAEKSQTQSQPLNDSDCCYGFEKIRLHGNGQKDHEVMMTNNDKNHCLDASQTAPSAFVGYPCSTSENDHEVVMIENDQNQCLDASQAAPSELVGHPCSMSANEVPRDALRGYQEKRRDPLVGSSREISTKLTKEKKTGHIKSSETYGKIRTKEENLSSRHQETIGTSKLCRKCRPSVAVKLVNLIEKWTPDAVRNKLTDSEDQEWWMFKKLGGTRHDQVSNYQTTSNRSFFMDWPTAQYLPEVELHALPFTVPF